MSLDSLVDQQVDVDLGSEVQYSPTAQWNVSSVSPCSGQANTNLTGYFTSSANASASLVFVGSSIIVSGAKNNLGGSMFWTMDNGTNGSGTVALYAQNAECSISLSVHVPNKTHTLVMSLSPTPTSTGEATSSTISPLATASTLPREFHLHNITIERQAYAQIPSPSASAAPAAKTTGLNITTTTFVVVGCIAGFTITAVGLLLLWRRKRRSRTRSLEPEHYDNPPQDGHNSDDMQEHRTTTTLSYGLSTHIVSSDDLALIQSATSSPSAASSDSFPLPLSPPAYISNAGDHWPPSEADFDPPPEYEEFSPQQHKSPYVP